MIQLRLSVMDFLHLSRKKETKILLKNTHTWPQFSSVYAQTQCMD